jgi:hypothetical protein
MGCAVYANGMSIACKVADGKTIAAMPDVCLSPPTPPAGPIPIPYPNTAMASNTDNGSKTVQIGGQEVMLKDQSTFKKSTGDEAATKSLGMGVITHQIQGKANFVAWSMDVKFEGENVPRHLDLMGHNEASSPPNTPPWLYLDNMAAPPTDHPCEKDIKKVQTDCKGSTTKQVGSREHRNCDEEGKCAKAMECILVPKSKDKEMCCSPDNTGDHLIEDHWVRPGGNPMPDFKSIPNLYGGAPTMCVNRSRYEGKHGIAHGTRGVHEDTVLGKQFPYSQAKTWAVEAHRDANPKAGCTEGCIESQLDGFYGDSGNKQCQASDRRQPLTEQQRTDAVQRVADGFEAEASTGFPA